MSKDSRDLRMDVQRTGDQTIVRFASGTSMNEYTADEVGRNLQSLISDRATANLVLDLGGVEYITSTILGHLVDLNRKLKAAGGHLRLDNAQPAVVEVFRVTMLDQVIEIRPAPG